MSTLVENKFKLAATLKLSPLNWYFVGFSINGKTMKGTVFVESSSGYNDGSNNYKVPK